MIAAGPLKNKKTAIKNYSFNWRLGWLFAESRGFPSHPREWFGFSVTMTYSVLRQPGEEGFSSLRISPAENSAVQTGHSLTLNIRWVQVTFWKIDCYKHLKAGPEIDGLR